MERVEIFGENYFGHWDRERTGCRGIVLRGGEILLCHETVTGLYMIPGGGLEPGESGEACCRRELAEETGLLVACGECALELNEYYENVKYVSHFFLCRPVGTTERRLTDRERAAGTEPEWVPVERALAEFARHEDYAATDEERRGLYLRDYTALRRLLASQAEGVNIRPMTIGDYDAVWALWMSCKNMGFNNLDDSREGVARLLARNPNTNFVAEIGGALAGVILAGQDGRRGYVYHMSVGEAYRRRGVGSALVDRCLAALKDEGINKVALLVFKYNDAGNAFWERMGFSLREDVNYRNRALTELVRIDT